MPHCSVVEGLCEVPAGIRAGSGYAEMPPARSLPTCPYCGEYVCRACSVPGKNGRRVCVLHDPAEVADWLPSGEQTASKTSGKDRKS